MELNSPMPVLYIAHGGGPCFFMEWTMGPRDTWDGMKSWLMNIPSTLAVRPKAIVVISAHWEEPEIAVINSDTSTLLYDYYGFPEETYRLEYKAPTAPEVAHRIAKQLEESNIPCRFEKERGLDHGVFIPLKVIYPNADIPVVQVSLKEGLNPAAHIELGRALAPLRNEGVLIVGSGMSYHNLRNFGGPKAANDSAAFDSWLQKTITQSDPTERSERLKQWKLAPSALEAHPREEHLVPLMVAAGAGGENLGRVIYSEKVSGMTISGFQFG